MHSTRHSGTMHRFVLLKNPLLVKDSGSLRHLWGRRELWIAWVWSGKPGMDGRGHGGRRIVLWWWMRVIPWERHHAGWMNWHAILDWTISSGRWWDIGTTSILMIVLRIYTSLIFPRCISLNNVRGVDAGHTTCRTLNDPRRNNWWFEYGDRVINVLVWMRNIVFARRIRLRTRWITWIALTRTWRILQSRQNSSSSQEEIRTQYPGWYGCIGYIGEYIG